MTNAVAQLAILLLLLTGMETDLSVFRRSRPPHCLCRSLGLPSRCVWSRVT
jgi:hypothetical protein